VKPLLLYILLWVKWHSDMHTVCMYENTLNTGRYGRIRLYLDSTAYMSISVPYRSQIHVDAEQICSCLYPLFAMQIGRQQRICAD